MAMHLTVEDIPTTWLFRGLRTELSDLLGVLTADSSRFSGRLSVASVGCSTGEEVYSLGVVLDDAGFKDVTLAGYDVSSKHVRMARRNKFHAGALTKALDKEAVGGGGVSTVERLQGLFRRYFSVEDDGSLTAMLRYSPTFQKADISAAPLPQKTDVVVCRNVAIYYESDPQKMRAIYNNLDRSVTDRGVMVVDANTVRMFMAIPEIKTALEERYQPQNVSGRTVVFARKQPQTYVPAPSAAPVYVPAAVSL